MYSGSFVGSLGGDLAKRKPPKPTRTSAQRAALARLNARARQPNGAPVSNEQLAARDAELMQRVVDRAFMSPLQRAKADAAEARVQEVKHEKETRYQRFQNKRTAYQWHAKPDALTLADADLIDREIVPAPTDTVEHGSLTEYIWTWQGHHALQTAQDFLRLAQFALPADSMGYLAMGNGHGKNATWIGTRFGNPRSILDHSHSFLSSQSQNTVAINALPFGARDPSIWVEVKLTTKGSVSHADSKAVRNRTERRRKAVGSRPSRVSQNAGTRGKAKVKPSRKRR